MENEKTESEKKEKILVDVSQLGFVEKMSLSKHDCASIVRIARQYNKDFKVEAPYNAYNLIPRQGTYVFIARKKDDKKIVGFTHLVEIATIMGVHARIEDVAVDEEFQKRGIGRQMMEYVIEVCEKNMQYPYLDLTSRPSREIANFLYPNLGFERRETNVYRKILQSKK